MEESVVFCSLFERNVFPIQANENKRAQRMEYQEWSRAELDSPVASDRGLAPAHVDVTRQHLEGGGLPRSVHPQKTETLQAQWGMRTRETERDTHTETESE